MIDKLHFWCNKVIPLVYDEALSYYETLCKLVYTINETIKNVRELNDNAVFSVNEITPDDDGNVNVGTVKSVNGSTPDASGNINLPTVSGVTSVDGVGADAQGNVQINAVKSVNGETPNTQGAVTIDVGTVKSVNGQTPNSQGDVTIDVGTVKSINNVTPNVSGDVQINVKNTRLTSNSGWTASENVTNDETNSTKRPQLGIIVFETQFTLSVDKEQDQVILSGLDVPTSGIPVWFLVRNKSTNMCYSVTIDYRGDLVTRAAIPAGSYEGIVTYSYSGEITIPITGNS